MGKQNVDEWMDEVFDLGQGEPRLKLGASGCILGQQVRFDGGHKRARFVTDTLSKTFEFVSVCPEMGIGLGTPRETIRLVRPTEMPLQLSVIDERPRLVGNRSGQDFSESMRAFGERQVKILRERDIVGFVLMKGSPSCGMERVRVYDHNGVPEPVGTGLFAQALQTHWSCLPLEESGRLNDPVLRDAFLTRVVAFARLNRLEASLVGAKPARVRAGLTAFHARYKLQLLAQSPKQRHELGELLAQSWQLDPDHAVMRYRGGLMRALKKPASPRRHAHVMMRAAGYLKAHLTHIDREELHSFLTDYLAGLSPRAVPLALLHHHVRRHEVPYLARQSYLEPYPKVLAPLAA